MTSVWPDDTSDFLNSSILVYSDCATQSNTGIFCIVGGGGGGGTAGGGRTKDQFTTIFDNVFFIQLILQRGLLGLVLRKLKFSRFQEWVDLFPGGGGGGVQLLIPKEIYRT